MKEYSHEVILCIVNAGFSDAVMDPATTEREAVPLFTPEVLPHLRLNVCSTLPFSPKKRSF